MRRIPLTSRSPCQTPPPAIPPDPLRLPLLLQPGHPLVLRQSPLASRPIAEIAALATRAPADSPPKPAWHPARSLKLPLLQLGRPLTPRQSRLASRPIAETAALATRAPADSPPKPPGIPAQIPENSRSPLQPTRPSVRSESRPDTRQIGEISRFFRAIQCYGVPGTAWTRTERRRRIAA